MIKDCLTLYAIKLAMKLCNLGSVYDPLEQAYNNQNSYLHYKKREKCK